VGKEEEVVNIFTAAEAGDVSAVDHALRLGVEVRPRDPNAGLCDPVIPTPGCATL
jgi:hypothetical protein